MAEGLLAGLASRGFEGLISLTQAGQCEDTPRSSVFKPPSVPPARVWPWPEWFKGVKEVSHSDLQKRTHQEDFLFRKDTRLSPDMCVVYESPQLQEASGSNNARILPQINALPVFTACQPCVCSQPHDRRRPCGRYPAVPGMPSWACFNDGDHSHVIMGTLGCSWFLCVS